MCGRTSLAVDPTELCDRFGASPSTAVDLRPRYNVAPGDDLVAIRDDAPDEIDRLEWGFLPSWATDPSDVPTPINARAETVTERAMFREAFDRRRCLLLADGFYEWAGQRGQKQPYRIERTDGDPYAYAGLWERRRQPDGTERATCVILTCEANGVVAPIHDRMPVILERDAESTWLHGEHATEVRATLKPLPDERLRAYPVPKRVNDPRNDDPALLEAVDVAQQTGLDEFGS